MNKLQKNLIFIIALFVFNGVQGQSDTTKTKPIIVSSDWIEYGLVVGGGYQGSWYGELGFYRSYVYEILGIPTFSTSLNLSSEFYKQSDWVIAPKFQGRLHMFLFNGSLSALFYSDLSEQNAVVVRPELGVGLWSLDINYGYNIKAWNNEFSNLPTHQLSIRVYLKFSKKLINEYDREGNIVDVF